MGESGRKPLFITGGFTGKDDAPVKLGTSHQSNDARITNDSMDDML